MEQEEIAIEELKTLQKVITHHEELAFRVKGWYIVAMGALAVASYHEHIIGLTWQRFLTIGLVIFVGFFYWILFHRDVVSLAIGRVHEVERALRFLREESIYDGPGVGRSLAHPTLPMHKSEEARWPRRYRIMCRDEQILVPAIVAIVLLGALTWFVPSAGSAAASPPVLVPPFPVPTPPPPMTSGIQSIISLWEIGALCLIIGGVAVLFVSRGRSKALMTIGAASMLAGAGLHVFTINKVDFKDFIKIERAELDLARKAGETGNGQITVLNTSMQPTTKDDEGRFGAQMLGFVAKFQIGDAAVESAPGSREALNEICAAWGRRTDSDNALVLIIGATDRLPLEGPTRLRYDANTGLALARAAAVKDYLTNNCWQSGSGITVPKNVLLLSSGPQHTPEFVNKRYTLEPDGFPADRRVDVLALSTFNNSSANRRAVDNVKRDGQAGTQASSLQSTALPQQ